MNREASLAGLEAAKAAFVEAIGAAPPEALSFRKPEDDYSLGGLIFHNVGVVAHYRLVLGDVVAGGFGEVRPQDPPGFWEGVAARSKEPLPVTGGAPALAELAAEHDAFAAELRALPGADWDRTAPVLYGDSMEALPTGAGDIVGWVRDHYLEHVAHVQELIVAWQESGHPPG